MLNIRDKTKCCGCGACVNICPNNCITMKEDEEGFKYPSVNPAFCIKCGACLKVCPLINAPEKDCKYTAYACKHKRLEGRRNSTSGGVFYAAAQYILGKGGVVFGAAFDKDFNVAHMCAQTQEQLQTLRGSKYVQSDTGLTFRQVKSFLEQDKYVLFCGTPCQIGGLKNYLQKPYKKLFCIELVCHGVPSPKVWRMFLEQNFAKDSIKAVNFRDKTLGWRYSSLKFYLKDGKISYAKLPLADRLFGAAAEKFQSIKYYVPMARRNFYIRGFIKDLFNRPSCHACAFKGEQRAGDLTLGDLWGISRFAPDIYDKDGVSFVSVNTDAGQELFDAFKGDLNFKPVPLSAAAAENPSLSVSFPAHPLRNVFFEFYTKVPLNALIKQLLAEKPLIYDFALKCSKRLLKILKIEE